MAGASQKRRNDRYACVNKHKPLEWVSRFEATSDPFVSEGCVLLDKCYTNNMANHCIEVICLGCGREWCVRGCNYDSGPSESHLKKFLANKQEWANKYNNGVLYMVETTDRCCVGSKVVMS